MKASKALNRLRDRIFARVHASNLIYNTCWEDPRCDRQLMNLGPNSKVVMITSAGCNALDYLLDDVAEVHTIDINPKQNALLALKLALLQLGRHTELWAMFGQGFYPEAETLYFNELRSLLPDYAQAYWDRKIGFFHDERKESFYFHGTSGKVAWVFRRYFASRPKLQRLIHLLLEAQSLEEQQQVYTQLEPKLMNKMVLWLMNRHFTLSLLGIPRAQRQLIVDEYPGGLSAYIRDNFRHVFTQLPIQENYFWHLYIKGHYSPQCCPNYLKPEFYSYLQARVPRVHLHVNFLTQFLKENPGPYTHYVLLDHQDWLAAHDEDALLEEWELILQNSVPGTQVLLRSAALKVDFFPAVAKEKISWDTARTAISHQQDRVGTYGSVYLGTVR